LNKGLTMSVKRIIVVALGLIILSAFVILGLGDAVKTKDKLDFQEVQLQSKSTEIQELNVKYEKLNLELEKAAKDKNTTQEQFDKLRKEKEELDRQNKELEVQLQAKREEKSRLAKASTRVVNAATGTRSVAAYSGGDVRGIIVAAANKYGIDVNRALRIAECESTFNPNSVNYTYWETDKNGKRHYPSGLFQHLTNYWPNRAAKYGYGGASVFDPVANANVTMGMWRDGAANLWECT
jgi:hypothetical protein